MVKFHNYSYFIFIVLNFILLEIHTTNADNSMFFKVAFPTLLPGPTTFPTRRYQFTSPSIYTTPYPERVFTTAIPMTTTTTAPPTAASNVVQEELTKILEKLDTMDHKVDQLQKEAEKTQSSLAKQKKDIEAIQAQAEENWSNLSSQMEDGFKHLAGLLSQGPSTTTTTSRPQSSTSTVDLFDVDIRARSLLSKFPLPGLPKNGTSDSFQGTFSSLPLPLSPSDLSAKLPSVPILNPKSENGTTVNQTLASTSESTIDETIQNYIPDVGLISDDPNLVRFLLYNPQNLQEYQILEFGNIDSIKSSRYDPKKKVKFLVHGFQQNFNGTYPQNVKDAYLEKYRQDYNVIIVDWGLLAIPNAPYISPVFYPFAVKNVWRTGVRLGEFISWLKNESLVSPDQVHIIGFSLGSHVSGRAAATVQEHLNTSISRVTALDPAGPEFYTGIFARKLTPDDATYVDVIHTNAGQLGIWANIGQVDYYVNGGSGPQPGCLGIDSVSAVVKSVTGTVSGSCSHNYATKIFADTIRSQNGVRSEQNKICSCSSLTEYKLGICDCEQMAHFGEHSTPETRGTLYLDYIL